METQNFDREKVVSVVRRNVSSLPFYEERQVVDASQTSKGIWACYEILPKVDHNAGLHLVFEKGICYLVHIGLMPELRGRGLGEAMYRSVERIALDMDCKRIRQIPGGRTFTGEARNDYLKRKLGYKDIFMFEDFQGVEKLLT